MKFIINKKITSNIPSTKLYDLGAADLGLETLLNDSIIYIDQNTIPVLKINDSIYLINDWNSKNIKESVELLLTEDDLIPLSGNGSGDVDSRPYKVYTALLTQSGTDAPVATVLENTLGATINFTYISPGVYVFNASSAVFTTEKSIVFATKNIEGGFGMVLSASVTSNSVGRVTAMSAFGGGNNDQLINASLEIRVYN